MSVVLTRPQGGGTGGVFGSQYNYAESLGVTTTTQTTFQEKLRLTTADIPAGTYRIGWSYQWNHNSTINDFECRIVLNGSTVLSYHQQEPKDSASNNGSLGPNPGPFSTTGTDQQFQTSGFTNVVLASGIHTVTIEFRTNDTLNESSIWNTRLEFWRVA